MNDVLSKCAELHEPIVVHVIDSVNPLEIILLREATDLAKQYPTILFNISNGRLVSTRASIPTQYTSERFDAGIWLKETLDAAGLIVKINKNNIKDNCSVSTVERIPGGKHLNAAKLDIIQSMAKKIAEKYMCT